MVPGVAGEEEAEMRLFTHGAVRVLLLLSLRFSASSWLMSVCFMHVPCYELGGTGWITRNTI